MSVKNRRVLFVAAENDSIPGAKVGGVADVVRDVPSALAALGVEVDVVIPDYGNGAIAQFKEEIHRFYVPFRESQREVVLYRYLGAERAGVTLYLIGDPLFENGGRVYCNDPPGRPFATDASKFALFDLAVCEALLQGYIGRPAVLHLHDWHSALCSLLLRTASRYREFAALRQVFTVHNIALQGIRPFRYDESSLEAWFPWLGYDGQAICDPRYPDCFNPMRCAINLTDKVHLVSPSYAEEVLEVSHPEQGFFGGEGLEQDLRQAAAQGKLSGILNGCEYPEEIGPRPDLNRFLGEAERALFGWMAQQRELKSVHYLAHQRLKSWREVKATGPLVTSIGRLTDQKVMLLRQRAPEGTSGPSVLDELCHQLERCGGRMVILGSGDEAIEQAFCTVMARSPSLLFLNGYGQSLSDELYRLGDIFLMPSSFEPCGISQMLALRAGQPCIVHNVGGLKDTIMDGFNGFSFSGENVAQQCEELIRRFAAALDCYGSEPQRWEQICDNAKASRFEWRDVATRYIDELYLLAAG